MLQEVSMLIIKEIDGQILEKTWREALLNDLEKIAHYHQLRKENKITIHCDCQEDGILMTISYFKSTDNYHIRSSTSQSDKHAKGCRFHTKYIGKSEHEPGWEKEEDANGNETYAITLDKAAFGKTTSSKKKEKSQGVESSLYYRNEIQINSGRKSTSVTIMGLASKLNMMSFEDFQRSWKNRGKLPQSKEELIRQAYGTARKIRIKRRKNLQDMWFNKKNGRLAKNKEHLFVFAPLASAFTNPKNENKVEVYGFMKGEKEKQRFFVDKELFIEARNRNKINIRRDKMGKPYFNNLLTGMVEKTTFKSGAYIFTFQSIEFLPVTDFGLWYESSHEEKVYTKLHKKNILFSKPYESLEFYHDYMPDILFGKPLNPDKVYIGEIFGMENDKDYNRRKKEKINLANDSTLFDLWYWDVTSGQPMDEFY